MYSVRRHRIGKDVLRSLQGVTCAPDSADQLLLPGCVHLLPEVGDVDLHDVGGDAELLVPYPAEKEVAREDPSRVAGHELEEIVLAGGEIYLPLPAPHLASGGVHLQVGNPQYLVALRTPQLGPDASKELVDLERLGHVVVGAEVEAVDLVDRGVAGGEHDDRHP